MKNNFWLLLGIILAQSASVWSWTSIFSRQGFPRDVLKAPFGSQPAPNAIVRRGGRSGTTTTALSVFGWFQNDDDADDDDEKSQDEESDGVVSAKLSGVAGIMNSMSSFKTSKRVSDRTNAVLQDLSNTIVEGTSTDGKVKVSYNGQQQPVGVQIDEAYFQSLGRKSGAGELSIAITEAMQEAHSKSASKIEEKVKSLYSDLGFET
jgi:DNA-binding protein YbaB